MRLVDVTPHTELSMSTKRLFLSGRCIGATLLLLCTIAFPACGGPQTDASDPQGVYVDAMAREHAGDDDRAAFDVEEAPPGSLVSELVAYHEVDGEPVYGRLVTPQQRRPAGAVILIHEWWGLNDNIARTAERLAGEGYVVLAVDMYRGQSASAPGEARALMQAALSQAPALMDNIAAAHAWLTARHSRLQVAVMGYCFGGALTLEAAINLPELFDAAVVYYGRVTDDEARLRRIEAPMLGIFAEEDGGIEVEDVRAFEAAMQRVGGELDLRIYPGVGHAFANPSGTAYQAEAAAAAWQRTLSFLRDHLGQ